MPQRFLRPGITTSEAWNHASWFEQSLFVRLLTLVDDEGRHDARIAIVHAGCFALRDDVTREQTASALAELHRLGLVECYEVDGKPYLQVARWQERARNKSRWPGPPSAADGCRRLPTAADGSQQQPSAAPIAISPRHIPSLECVVSRTSPGDGNAADSAPPGKRGSRATPTRREAFKPPSLEEVKFAAAKIGLPEHEAVKFHAHFMSNGWKVGGRTPMRSYQHALIKWKCTWEEKRHEHPHHSTTFGHPGPNPRNAAMGVDEERRSREICNAIAISTRLRDEADAREAREAAEAAQRNEPGDPGQ
ncbi:MAG: hypothetical protein H7A46_26665 [Verrucomicrobiales bacterium]|nr:hypothetical protein [Verrucomicrobiales bacterium]